MSDAQDDAHLQLLLNVGFVAMPHAIDEVALAQVQTAVSARIAAAEAILSKDFPEIDLGTTLFAFQEMSSRGRQRFDLLFEEGASDQGSATIFSLARQGPWVEMIRAALSRQLDEETDAKRQKQDEREQGLRCQVSVVYSRPGADAQDWHSDGNHRGATSGWHGEQASTPYALCVFVPLVDLDSLVGFTQFWPGTHHHPKLAGFGASAPILGCNVDATLAAGGAAIYDYRLLHRGMPNRSSVQRPVLQFIYHTASYRETKNFGHTYLFPRDPSAPPSGLTAGVPC